MTWIVGAAPPIGYAVGISDIRVTFGDGTRARLLTEDLSHQPIRSDGICRNSVRIGFAMVDALKLKLQHIPINCGWFPEDVAEDMTEVAKKIFAEAEPAEQALHSHLMILGAHPFKDVGIPGYARTSVYILKSPEFVPEHKPGQVVSIGSGSWVAEYRAVLDAFSADVLSLIKGEMMGQRMGFSPLSFIMQKTVEQHPTPGISPHTHICVVRRGSIFVGNSDEDRYPPNGEKSEIRMPPTALSWEEFCQLATADNKSPYAASC